MKKILLAAFLFLFLFFLLPSNTLAAAQYCACTPDTVGGCTEVVENECGTGYEASCQSSGGSCLGCKCISKTTPISCTQSPDSCKQADPKSYCKCDYDYAGNPNCACASSYTPPGQTKPVSPPSSLCSGDKGIDTAIGCIPFDTPANFITFILKWAVGVGSGVAFLLIIVASFQIMTSSGNPDRLQAGKELLGAAIGGLILLIFSVFILKVIGVDILQIPGLT